jgi:hypothetical protein
MVPPRQRMKPGPQVKARHGGGHAAGPNGFPPSGAEAASGRCCC